MLNYKSMPNVIMPVIVQHGKEPSVFIVDVKTMSFRNYWPVVFVATTRYCPIHWIRKQQEETRVLNRSLKQACREPAAVTIRKCSYSHYCCRNVPLPPVDPTPAPVDPSPAPVDPTPAPIDPTPSPLDQMSPPVPTSGSLGGAALVVSILAATIAIGALVRV